MENKDDIDRIYEKLEKIDDKLNSFIGVTHKLETKVYIFWILAVGAITAKMKGFL